mgnify:FL=1
MPKVSNFIYCMNSNTSDTEANALGVISAITPDFVPGAFSFSILCSILDLEEKEYGISIQFINPKGEVLVDVNGTVQYKENVKTNLPKEYKGINISSNWQNVLFKESGIYKTIVKIDDIDCGTFEIYVKGKNEED